MRENAQVNYFQTTFFFLIIIVELSIFFFSAREKVLLNDFYQFFLLNLKNYKNLFFLTFNSKKIITESLYWSFLSLGFWIFRPKISIFFSFQKISRYFVCKCVLVGEREREREIEVLRRWWVSWIWEKEKLRKCEQMSGKFIFFEPCVWLFYALKDLRKFFFFL